MIENAIFIDGIGLNLKTSSINKLVSDNKHILSIPSDSSFFMNHGDYPYDDCKLRGYTRGQQIYVLSRSNSVIDNVIFDRGCVNHAAWLYVYGKEDEAYRLLDDFITFQSFPNNSRAILVVNESTSMVSEMLSKESVDSPRLKEFVDVNTYMNMQDRYVSFYYKNLDQLGNFVTHTIKGNNIETEVNNLKKTIEKYVI